MRLAGRVSIHLSMTARPNSVQFNWWLTWSEESANAIRSNDSLDVILRQ